MSCGSYRKVLRTVAEDTRKAVWARQPVVHSFEVRLDAGPSVRYLLGNTGPRDERTDGETNDPQVLTVQQVLTLSPDDAGVFVAVEQVVHNAAAALNLDPTLASYGSVDEVYLKVLGRDILAESSLTFSSTD